MKKHPMKRNYTIKPKPTFYNGILFRSQLEARWAVFFDCLGIAYQYEPHSYEVETGGRCVNYKPDFFLPGLSKYLEIKPSKPASIENTRCAAWTKYIGDIYLLFHLGPPTENNENGWFYSHDESMKGPPLLCEDQCWCECPKCGKVDLEEFGNIESCGCFSADYYNLEFNETGVSISKGWTESERMIKAYRQAKNRKFDQFGVKKATRIVSQRFLF